MPIFNRKNKHTYDDVDGDAYDVPDLVDDASHYKYLGKIPK